MIRSKSLSNRQQREVCFVYAKESIYDTPIKQSELAAKYGVSRSVIERVVEPGRANRYQESSRKYQKSQRGNVVGRLSKMTCAARKRGDVLPSIDVSVLEVSLIEAKNCCICDTPFKTNRQKHIDHCHTTGKFRGILCPNCNHLLGKAHDSIHILKRAIEYLEETC